MADMTIITEAFIPTYTGDIVGYNAVSQYACAEVSTTQIYWLDTEEFETASAIWLNNDGTGVPDAGWYALDGEAMYWDGTEYTSEATCVNSVEVPLGTSSTLVSSCEADLMPFYLIEGQTLSTATAIYEDEYLTTMASAGWYSDGSDSRYWNGVDTIGGITECIASTQIDLTLGTTNLLSCENTVTTTYYMDAAYTFETAPMFYTDSDLTAAISTDGFYAYQGYTRELSSGVLGDQVLCEEEILTPTTSVFLAYGAGQGGDDTACEATEFTEYWFPTADGVWTNASSIGTTFDYLDNAATVPTEGYYADADGILRLWDGTEFDSTSICTGAIATCYYWTVYTDDDVVDQGDSTKVTMEDCSGTEDEITAAPGASITFCGNLLTIDNLVGWSGEITDSNVSNGYGSVIKGARCGSDDFLLELSSSSYSSAFAACDASIIQVDRWIGHTDTPVVGDTVYTTFPQDGASVLDGGSEWYNDGNGNAYQISSAGKILAIIECTAAIEYKVVNIGDWDGLDNVDACDNTTTVTGMWFDGSGGTPQNGDTIYTDESGTVFVGGGSYRKIGTNLTGQISNEGILSNTSSCYA